MTSVRRCPTADCPRSGQLLALCDVWQGRGTAEGEAARYIRRAWVCKACGYEEAE